MPAPLRITLTEEEDRTLSELRQAQSVPYHTRDRAHMLRLNAQGMNVPAIAEVFQCHQQTVRATLKRWEQNGLGGLWEAPGRGAKAKWQPADLDYLTDCLAQEQRTYNSVQLAQKLKQERLVDLSSDRLRRLLKKKMAQSGFQGARQAACSISYSARLSLFSWHCERTRKTLVELGANNATI
jgi:transposase